MKYLMKFNESKKESEQLNWHTWNNTLKQNTIDFTEDELEILQKYKEHCKKYNYDVEIYDCFIVMMPTKFEEIAEPKSEIWKHNGYYVIQTSKMWRKFGSSYEEGTRKAFKCIENNVLDVIKNYNIF